MDQMNSEAGRADRSRVDPGGGGGRERTWTRRLPVGAEVVPSGGVHFRVWAPKQRSVEVVLRSGPGAPATVALSSEDDGCFAGLILEAAAGTRYAFRLGGADGPVLADPASRYQPEGLDGPSEVVDPSSAHWTDRDWRGVKSNEGQVLYEL